MSQGTAEDIETLKAYAAGERGTRATIERLGMRDYVDLVIALVQHDLDLPRPSAAVRSAGRNPWARDLWSGHDPEVRDAVRAILSRPPDS